MTGVMEERFAAFLRPGYFSRVDNQHPLELYIGLDEKGEKPSNSGQGSQPEK